MPLQLKYAFFTTPYPIVASSQDGGDPSTIDVQVVINPLPGLTEQFSMVKIEIPVGADTANNLSLADLPTPQVDSSIPWTITTSGSTITLIPSGGGTGTFSETGTTFYLKGISVNHYAGTVPITITESIGSGSVTDNTTYSLVKKPSTFAVTNFYADPPALNDLDEPVTIYWTGSDQVVYDLYSDVLPARDCVDTDNCYTAADGAAGVTSQPFQNSGAYIFTLEIIQAQSDGTRQVIDTVELQVNVNLPTIVEQSCIAPPLAYGNQSITIHWLALYTSSVSVYVDGTLYDANAPVDTYQDGYTVVLNSSNPSTIIKIVAYSVSKNTEANYDFTIPLLAPLVKINLGDHYMQNVMYPVLCHLHNTTQLIVMGAIQGYAALVDYNAQTVQPILLDQGTGTYAAVSPDAQNFIFSTAVPNQLGWLPIGEWGSEWTTLDCFMNVVDMQSNPGSNSVWVLTADTTNSLGALGQANFATNMFISYYQFTQAPTNFTMSVDSSIAVVSMGDTLWINANNTAETWNFPGHTFGRVFLPPNNSYLLAQVDESYFAIMPLSGSPPIPPLNLNLIPTDGNIYRMVVTADNQYALMSIISKPGGQALALLDVTTQQIVDVRDNATPGPQTTAVDFYVYSADQAMLAMITNDPNGSPYFVVFNPTLLPPIL